ncbi:hypothetical protein G7Z17_g4470 [Cylindrodendrum hubeiense]|uniref:Xylanolytic transcriptional activator regulatory domain-containing protein n=1 Tax=Cylindrodendrum hubeiense TaxID=595255 RepID=A0A9P5HDX6_9HYPO|nr:hypothetical protein G7Z17_g4470 [Cylindrodendrum hubeiense]
MGRRRAPLRTTEPAHAVSPSPQPDRVEAMEARLASIESHLAQLATAQPSTTGSLPQDIHHNAGADSFTPATTDRSGTWGPSPSMNKWNDVEPASLACLGFSLQQVDADMIVTTKQPELPPLSEVLPTVDNYFQNYNRLTPLFDEPTFMRILLDWYSSPSKRSVVPWAAINIVLAISFRILDDLPMDDPRLSHCVRNVQSAMADLMTWREDLMGVQVLLGLVIVYQGCTNPQLAIGLVGTVTRLAQSMRLPSKQALIGHSPAVALRRSRIFWIAYIVDRDLSLRAKAPYTQLDSETDVEPPEENPEDGIGVLHSAKSNVRFNYLRARVQLAFIEGKAYDVLYSRRAQNLNPQQRLASVSRIENMLYDWHKKIPEEFQHADTIAQLPQMYIQILMNMYYRHLECLFRIHSVFLFDDGWMSRVNCYLSPTVIEIREDEVDGEVVRSNLAPLPSGWAACVKYCRYCLTLANLGKQTEYSFWLQTCGASSCLIILLINMIEFPAHELVSTDRQLIDGGREIFGQRKMKTPHEYCGLLTIADELDRRARGQVKRIAQSQATEFSGLMDDELVLITGANGSLALPFVERILTSYPSYTVIAAVRNPSPESDSNTANLTRTISSHNGARAHIEALDLASIKNIRSFSNRIAERVANGELPPIDAIVCNAFTWSLNGQLSTADGFERTFQVGHLAHYLLVLKLLGSMAPNGRVVMLGSANHYPEKPVPISKLGAEFPSEIDTLIKPGPDSPGDEHDRGFQRYATTKLANVMFMQDLNDRLLNDPKLSGITVTAMDPGGLVDSRANALQKPAMRVVFAVANAILPLVKRFTSEIRRSIDSAQDLVELSVGDKFKDVRGYHVGLAATEPAKVVGDKAKARLLWAACWKWTEFKEEETVLLDIYKIHL